MDIRCGFLGDVKHRLAAIVSDPESRWEQQAIFHLRAVTKQFLVEKWTGLPCALYKVFLGPEIVHPYNEGLGLSPGRGLRLKETMRSCICKTSFSRSAIKSVRRVLSMLSLRPMIFKLFLRDLLSKSSHFSVREATCLVRFCSLVSRDVVSLPSNLFPFPAL